MKTEKSIWTAFCLNIIFSITELIGGIVTGSVAIVSDSLHDLSDAGAIAVSAILEWKSKRPPDKEYTYGYGRLSVIGGAINAIILLVGSIIVIYSAMIRLLHPSPVHYGGMIIMAVFGVAVNFLAAYVTHSGDSMNQKTVNLHMMEDLLGWVVVLIGAIVMKFTDWWFIDPLMSVGVAVFIFYHAYHSMAEILGVLLEKVPRNINIADIEAKLSEINGLKDAHHIHIWSLDGNITLATMHIVTDEDAQQIKEKIRQICNHIGINHATIEIENTREHYHEHYCNIQAVSQKHDHHHHHG